MKEHDSCPHCGVSLQGEPIPEKWLKQGLYGPWDGVTPQFYQRTIGIEVMGLYDGTCYWRCPDCGGEWPRKGMQWAWDARQAMPSDAAFREAVEAMLDAIEGHDDVVCCESDDGSHEWVLFPSTMKDFLRARVLALYAERLGEERVRTVMYGEAVVLHGRESDPTVFLWPNGDYRVFHDLKPGDRVRVTKVEDGQ